MPIFREDSCVSDEDKADVLAHNSISSGTSCEFPLENSLGSIKSDGCLSSDSESMELYQPSSPFQMQEDFILPDIIEENEETEVESTQNELDESPEQSLDVLSHHSSLEDGELDVEEKETVFENEEGYSHAEQDGESPAADDPTVANFDPPVLPISPPPGPLLSPEFETTTTEAEFPPHQHSPSPSPPHERRRPSVENRYRHSVAGSLEDVPPPLPLAPPPGKLISPRHSRFFDLADISRSSSKGQVDLSQLMLKMSTVVAKEATEEEKIVAKEEKMVVAEEARSKNQSMKSDQILTMVPPVQDESDGDLNEEDNPLIIRQRLGSYHLKTFEPPKEFSDSGFQDTDVAAEQASKVESIVNVMPAKGMVLSSVPTSGMERKLQLPFQRIDSSVTCTSDEQLTENSESVGLKTIASSGSEEVSGNVNTMVR